jgi:hypothetical protein
MLCCCCFHNNSLDTRARAYGDNLAENPRYLEKSKHYYDYNTPLFSFAKVCARGRQHQGG